MAQDLKKAAYGDRLEDFAVRIIRFAAVLPKTEIGKHIAGQSLRAGTSPGANYAEAQGAESRADFAHKMNIVVKELRETRFWLRVSAKASLIPESKLSKLMNEVDELIAIGIASAVTAKKNARQKGRSS